MKFSKVSIVTILLILSGARASRAQQHDMPGQSASLDDLLAEAERNNPQIQAAYQSWQAARQIPSQVSTLPDPEVMFQQLSVGSPRPFSGYTNSEMANVALGVSQDLPYPGKLHLKGEIATQDAAVVQQQYESVRRDVLSRVKSAYFELAYHFQMLGILESDGALLAEVEKAADARYRSGMGNQQDVLQAQLEQTKLLREITMHHLEVAKAQAQIKQLLNRPQSSADIEAVEMPDTPLPYTYDELLAAAQAQDPDIAGAQRMVEREKLQVDLAHKDFDPDFNVQYMWFRTDPFNYRARYQLSVGIRIPIYRTRRQQHELAEAEADLSRSRSEAESETQQVAAELRAEYDTAQKTADLLKIYREGLLPQARAEFQAGLAEYQNNRQDFQALLAAFLDVLNLDEEYWQNSAERETALAQIEQFTGLSLRKEGATQ